jgi:hypothetical protein
MNLESLVTVASLIAAVYAIIPRARRLEISFRFGFFGWVIIVGGFLSVVYLQFYQTFKILGLTPDLNLARWGINQNNASFIVLLCTTLTLYIYILLRSLSRSNIEKFWELVLELSQERQYAELFYLTQKYIDRIESLYISEPFWVRLKNYLVRNSGDFSFYFDDFTSNKGRRKRRILPIWLYEKIIWPVNKRLSLILPENNRYDNSAKNIIYELLLNERIVQAIASRKPYFALQVLQKNFYENQKFIEIYLRLLASDTQSVLYFEIKNNQDIGSRDEYIFPERNRLLHYLFSDCRVAEKYQVYRPIGNFVTHVLDRLYSDSLSDPYNEPMGDFMEQGQWESEITCGIIFFDIMVTSALYQNICWHMWLYYFPHFVEKIIRNLNPNDKNVDLSDEWPTRYHYCISEIVSILCKWILAVEHLPSDQENIQLKNISPSHENENIPKSSLLTLGGVLKKLLTSQKIDFRFKAYIMGTVYRCYFDLMQKPGCKNYAIALMNSIVNGGFGLYSISAYEYLSILIDTFEYFDRIPYDLEISQNVQSLLLNKLNEA